MLQHDMIHATCCKYYNNSFILLKVMNWLGEGRDIYMILLPTTYNLLSVVTTNTSFSHNYFL